MTTASSNRLSCSNFRNKYNCLEFRMDITVAICTWNRFEQLRATLEAMTQIKVPLGVRWELMVVDNNSNDATPKVIDSFTDRLPLRNIHEARQGKSFALNRAIEEARGEYIFWTDDDVAPDEHWMEATYQAFQQANADLVYGIIRPMWLSETPSWYSYSLFNGKFALLDLGTKSFVATNPSQAFYGANNAGRRAVLKKLNGYREDLGPNGLGGGDEDTELFERALRTNAKIVYEPQSVIWHRIGEERCTKRFHRHRAWRSRASYFCALQLKTPPPTKLLRLPRYLYRIAISDAWNYLVSVLRRDASNRFYYELRLILFAGAFYQAISKRHK